MTTKRTKKTEATETAAKTSNETPLQLHTSSLSIEEIDGGSTLESLDKIVEGINALRTDMARSRAAAAELQVKPWHVLVAFWLGAVATAAGVSAVTRYEASKEREAA